MRSCWPTHTAQSIISGVVIHLFTFVNLAAVFHFLFCARYPKNVENCVALIYFTDIKRGKHNYKKTLYEGRSAALNFLWPVVGPAALSTSERHSIQCECMMEMENSAWKP